MNKIIVTLTAHCKKDIIITMFNPNPETKYVLYILYKVGKAIVESLFRPSPQPSMCLLKKEKIILALLSIHAFWS